MLKKILILISVISSCNLAIAQDIIPLPPIVDSKQQDSINKIKSSQGEVKTEIAPQKQSKIENKSVKKIPIKIGLSKTEEDIYLSLVSTLCIFINEQDDASCRVKQFNNDIEAMNGMLNGDVDMLMTNSLFAKYTTDGNPPFDDKNMQIKKLRFIGSFFDEKLTILANRDLNIQNLDDLKKTSINIGKDFTKEKIFFDEILKVKNWQISDFKRSVELEKNEELKAICDKTIDSTIIIGEDMNQYMKNITRFCEVSIVPITTDLLNLFKNDSRFLQAKIVGGMYIGIPKDIETIAIRAILVTTSDVPSWQIEKLLKIVKDNSNKIRLLHQSLNDLKIESILSEGRIAPLHDGVIQFMEKNNLKE